MNRKALFIIVVLILLVSGAVAALADRTERDDKHVFMISSGGSWLGVYLADLGDERARELGMREEGGAEIRSVASDSPAAEAGLEKGDVILEYQDTPVIGVAQLTRLVRETPAGRTVSLEVFRDGSVRTLEVKLAERKRDIRRHVEILKGPHDLHRIVIPDFEMPDIDIEIPDIPDIPGLMALRGRMKGRLGIGVENLTVQLGDHFGVEEGKGVLVESVKKDSRGEEAGLRAGDVIIRVDDDPVDDVHDLRMALRGRRGEAHSLTVVRDKQERTLSVPASREDQSSTDSPGEMRWIEDRAEQRAMLAEQATRVRAEAERARGEHAESLEEYAEALEEARLAAAEARRERARMRWAVRERDNSI